MKMFYQVNCKGMQPTYYTSVGVATKEYLYLKKYFGHCSIREIAPEKMIYKLNKGA